MGEANADNSNNSSRRFNSNIVRQESEQQENAYRQAAFNHKPHRSTATLHKSETNESSQSSTLVNKHHQYLSVNPYNSALQQKIKQPSQKPHALSENNNQHESQQYQSLHRPKPSAEASSLMHRLAIQRNAYDTNKTVHYSDGVEPKTDLASATIYVNTGQDKKLKEYQQISAKNNPANNVSIFKGNRAYPFNQSDIGNSKPYKTKNPINITYYPLANKNKPQQPYITLESPSFEQSQDTQTFRKYLEVAYIQTKDAIDIFNKIYTEKKIGEDLDKFEGKSNHLDGLGNITSARGQNISDRVLNRNEIFKYINVQGEKQYLSKDIVNGIKNGTHTISKDGKEINITIRDENGKEIDSFLLDSIMTEDGVPISKWGRNEAPKELREKMIDYIVKHRFPAYMAYVRSDIDYNIKGGVTYDNFERIARDIIEINNHILLMSINNQKQAEQELDRLHDLLVAESSSFTRQTGGKNGGKYRGYNAGREANKAKEGLYRGKTNTPEATKFGNKFKAMVQALNAHNKESEQPLESQLKLRDYLYEKLKLNAKPSERISLYDFVMNTEFNENSF